MKTQLLSIFLFSLIALSIQWRTFPAPKKPIETTPAVTEPAVTEPPATITNDVASSEFDKAPWQVSLRIHGIHYCSGAIISENRIATSVECIVDANDVFRGEARLKKFVTVKVGGPNSHSNDSIYTIKRARYDSNHFVMPLPNDELAMIEINGRFNLDGPGAPKKLSISYRWPLADGKEFDVTSLGYDTQYSNVSTDLKVQRWRKVKDNRFMRLYNIARDAFLAERSDDNVENPCTVGDIGDPLVLNGDLLGLKTYKKDCQLFPHTPTAFIRVAKYSSNILFK